MALEVARRYYLHDESTPDLALEYGVSRSTISRLIAHARSRGWVRIEVKDPTVQSDRANLLIDEYGLEAVFAVPTSRPSANMVDEVGRAAADILRRELADHSVIGVAWGETTAAITRHLPPTALVGCTVVQLNGAGTYEDLGGDHAVRLLSTFSGALNAESVLFPVPAFFDSPDTRDAMWNERSVQRVLNLQQQCNVAVFSVGSTRAEHQSRVYRGGYLTAQDRAQLASDGAVGDIATYFYDCEGRTDGIDLNRRASGIHLDHLRAIERKYCVAAGAGKADAVAGALRGGYIDRLIADSALLDAVTRIARPSDA